MRRSITSTLVILIAVIITANWFFHTPHGLYEKAFTIGSSVCHQIPSHSFKAFGIQFPLCARCSGLYLGSFIGLVYYFTQGKKSAIPKKGFVFLLIFFFLAWAGDGVNSFITAFLNKTVIYETTNMTRLVTGFGMGLVMSTALMTLFNLTVWKEVINSPLLFSPLQVAAYAADFISCRVDINFGKYHLFSSFCVYKYCNGCDHYHNALCDFLDNIIEERKQFYTMEIIRIVFNCRVCFSNAANYIA